MGVTPQGTKDDIKDGRNVPTLGMGDVLMGNVKKRTREHAEKMQEEQIRIEKESLERKKIEADLRKKQELADAKMAARREEQLREKQRRIALLKEQQELERQRKEEEERKRQEKLKWEEEEKRRIQNIE